MAEPITPNLLNDRTRYPEPSPNNSALPGNTVLTPELPAPDPDAKRGSTLDNASDKAREIAERTRENFKVVADQVREKMNDLTDRASEMADQAGQRFNEMKETLNQRIPEWKERARVKATEARRAARKAADQADRTARTYPIHTALAAAGAGFVLGAAMRVWRSNRG